MATRPMDQLVGERIWLLMRQQGMTQTALARRLGVHQVSVSHKLAGRRPWYLDELAVVAEALGIDLRDLFGFGVSHRT